MKWNLLCFATLVACSSPSSKEQVVNPPDPDLVLALGSCNNQSLPQPMWTEIIDDNPDIWVWLGDNIYGDADDLHVLVDKYHKQLQNPDYQKLVEATEVIGTWDDHDYGENNGGSDFGIKAQSQQAMLDFLGVPKDAPVRTQEGVYQSYAYERNDLKVKVILLDVRYHRDQLIPGPNGYEPNDTGTMLGEEQWQWLAAQVENSDADIHIIGSGIQILSAQHPFEKWANFPNERQRLLDLISSAQPRGVILVSGDRHIAEISEIEVEGLSYPVRDITTSGLTHSYDQVGDEPNDLRVSPLIGQKNFALLSIGKNDSSVQVNVQLKGLSDKTFYAENWYY